MIDLVEIDMASDRVITAEFRSRKLTTSKKSGEVLEKEQDI